MSQAVVAIAGATGFVGTAIRNSLLEQFTVRGLTRSAYKLSNTDLYDLSRGISIDDASLSEKYSQK